MSFTAQYHGECARCGGELKGHETTYGPEDKLFHVKCPDSDLDPPKFVPLCQRCFTYHNGECL